MGCAANSELKCEQTCQQSSQMQFHPNGYGVTSGSNSFTPQSMWGALQPTQYEAWINQIQSLNIMNQNEITRIAQQRNSSPNDMFLLLNKYIKTSAASSQQTRQTLETIFQQLDRCCRPTGGWTKSYDGTHLLRTSECFVNGAMRPVVPTIVYSHWIKHLRDLGLLSNKEICDGEDYARTRPEKLVEMMNMVFNERAKTVSRIKRDKLLNMITDISRYTSLGNPRNLPSNYFVNIPPVPI